MSFFFLGRSSGSATTDREDEKKMTNLEHLGKKEGGLARAVIRECASSATAELRHSASVIRECASRRRLPLFAEVLEVRRRRSRRPAQEEEGCARLKILVLRSLKIEDQAHIPKLIGKWKELEHLEMASNPSSFPSLAAEISLNCKKFTGLKMAGLRTKDALAIVNHLPNLKYLNLSNSYMPKETLLMIMNACKEMEVLIVNHCIGFRSDDDEVMATASRIRVFKHAGSKLMDDTDYDSDDCVPFCMFCYDCNGYRSGQCLP